MSDEQALDKSIGYNEALGEEVNNPPVPSSGDTILALDKEWRISPIEQRIKGQFEQWVRRGAKLAIKEAEEEDGSEEASSMRSAYQADWGAGHYTWEGRHCRRALTDIPGIRYLIYLLLRRCHPDITEETAGSIFVDNPKGCGDAYRWALGNLRLQARSNGAKRGTDTRKQSSNEPVTLDD